MEDVILCPKTKELVDKTTCIALKNLQKVMADFFSKKICTSVQGCPKEDYCLVFESGWNSVGSLLHATMKED